MEVRVYATLRPIVGGRSVSLPDRDAATVADVIDDLIGRFPALRERLLSDESARSAPTSRSCSTAATCATWAA